MSLKKDSISDKNLVNFQEVLLDPVKRAALLSGAKRHRKLFQNGESLANLISMLVTLVCQEYSLKSIMNDILTTIYNKTLTDSAFSFMNILWCSDLTKPEGVEASFASLYEDIVILVNNFEQLNFVLDDDFRSFLYGNKGQTLTEEKILSIVSGLREKGFLTEKCFVSTTQDSAH